MPPKKRPAVPLAQAKFAAVEKIYGDAKAKCDCYYDHKRRMYEHAMSLWGLIERDSLAAVNPACFAVVTCAEEIGFYNEMVGAVDDIIAQLRTKATEPGVPAATITLLTESAKECIAGFREGRSDAAIHEDERRRVAEKWDVFAQLNRDRSVPLPDVDSRDHSTHTAPDSLPTGYIQLLSEYCSSQRAALEQKDAVDAFAGRTLRMQLLAKAASILPDCHVAWRLLFFYLEDGSETVKIGGLEYNAAQCLATVVELLPRDFGSWWRLGVHLRTGPSPLTTVVRVSGESLRYTDCFMRAAKLQPNFVPCQECLKPEVPLPGGSLPPFRFPKLPKDSPEGCGLADFMCPPSAEIVGDEIASCAASTPRSEMTIDQAPPPLLSKYSVAPSSMSSSAHLPSNSSSRDDVISTPSLVKPPQPVPAPIQPPRPRISVGVLAVGIGCTAVLAAVAAKYRRR